MIEIEYRSRILEHCPKEFLLELQALVNKRSISDNNKKSNMALDLLQKYNIEYLNLGSGTNRVAVLIDGYVFKLALDHYGIKDNDSEFALSTELYPMVIKTYETNGIISVCEYVELITSIDEFQAAKSKIISKLSKIVSMGFLVGDVGFNTRNFCNWGKRTLTGELVILDFAYIYKLDPYKMKCQKCNQGIIEFDSNFIDLVCQNCHRVIKFTEMRALVISEEDEREYIDDAKNSATVLESSFKVEEDKSDAKEDEEEEDEPYQNKHREKRTMRDIHYKNSLDEYTRWDEPVVPSYAVHEEEEEEYFSSGGTIFDHVERDRLPDDEEYYDDDSYDSYDAALAEMRRAREEEVRIDGTRPGALKGVMGEDGLVHYLRLNPGSESTTKKNPKSGMISVTKGNRNRNAKERQPVITETQKPRIPVVASTQKHTAPAVVVAATQKHTAPVAVATHTPTILPPRTSDGAFLVHHINSAISESIDIVALKMEEALNRAFVAFADRMANTVNAASATPAAEIATEVDIEVDDGIRINIDHMVNMEKIVKDSVREADETESEYEEEEAAGETTRANYGEDTAVTIPPEKCTVVEAAIDNIQQVKETGKYILKPKICPNDPNTAID